MKPNIKLIGAGILTAIASSLCCIVPVLALVAGSTGAATTFSWMEPLRPYLILFTVIILGYTWWKKLKPVAQDDCDCEVDAKKSSFIQSKKFLGIITVFAILMTAFPYFSNAFYPANNEVYLIVDSENSKKVIFEIEGMTCDACENHVNHAVNNLSGIISVTTSYDHGNAEIEFDKTITSIDEIAMAINSTGYEASKKILK
ncbi:MAG: heavy metal transporter [Flavobacteriales bacterium]|nr:MAG: heavy metal transporter [Flavobacteriales bacterium]